MSDTDKIKELEDRIKELENELEGASEIFKAYAPMFKSMGILTIHMGNVDMGSQMIVFVNSLQDPENIHKAFKKAYKNREIIREMGKMLETEMNKLMNELTK